MNRFKKELRKKGIKLESDYPWLPFELKSGGIIEGVKVLTEYGIVEFYFTSMIERVWFDRGMNPIPLYMDTDSIKGETE